MDNLTWGSIQEKLRPGMRLYHRADHIRDMENTYGEMVLLSFDEDYLKCRTRKGDKEFPTCSIGKNVLLSKEEGSSRTVLSDGYELSEQELEQYKPADARVFAEEKANFKRV